MNMHWTNTFPISSMPISGIQNTLLRNWSVMKRAPRSYLMSMLT